MKLNTQDDLSRFFDEIFITETNPHIITYSNVFKLDGEVKHTSNTENVKLSKLDLIDGEYLKSIINQIILKSENKVIEFYPKGIFKFIKSNKIKNVYPFIKNLSANNFLITSKNLKESIKSDCPIYDIINDNIIIIGERSRIIIRESKDEVNFDYKKFLILHLI